MRLPVSHRLSLAISLVLLLSVSVTAALNFFKFSQVMEALEERRYGFVARDIATAFEQNLNLGLPIDQIENGRAMLERQLALDPAITRIEVRDALGERLYEAARAAAGGTAERFTIRTITNDFGQGVAEVAVFRSPAQAAARDRALLTVLLLAIFGVMLAGISIVVLGTMRLLRDVRRRLLDTAQTLRSTMGGGAPAAGRETALAAAAAAAFAEIATVEAAIERAAAREAARESGR